MKSLTLLVLVALVFSTQQSVAQFGLPKKPIPPGKSLKPSHSMSSMEKGGKEKKEEAMRRQVEAMVSIAKGQMETILFARMVQKTRNVLSYNRKSAALQAAQGNLKQWEDDQKLNIELYLIILRQLFHAQVEAHFARMDLAEMLQQQSQRLQQRSLRMPHPLLPSSPLK
jgi:hypothetical protein